MKPNEPVTVRTRFHFCGHVEDIPAHPRSVLAAGPINADAPVWCSTCEHLRYVSQRRVL